MTPEFWYTTILFVITVIGAIFAIVKLVFKMGKFTQALDNNLEASAETLVYIKGLKAKHVELDKRVTVLETRCNLTHGRMINNENK